MRRLAWGNPTLDEVCEINPRDPGPEDHTGLVSFVPMAAVSDTEGAILEHGARPFQDVAKGYTRFREDDVIFAKITPCMENGKIAVAGRLHGGLACGSTEFHVLRCRSSVIPKYLWYFLRQKSFREEAERHMSGAVGQRRVPAQYLRGVRLPLPDKHGQERIIAALDRLLERTKCAREDLEKVPNLIDRYRQAILASAFRGDLTAKWRSDGANDTSKWRHVTLGTLATDVRYGTAAKCHYEPKTTPVLRIPNVVDGRIALGDLKYGTFTKKESEKLALRPGDLLVIRSNGSVDLVGRAALVPEEAADFLFAGYLIRIRLDNKLVRPAYVHYAFGEPGIRGHIARLAKSTSGVNNINSEQLKAIEIPVPPLDEQDEIVSQIAVAFAKVDAALQQSRRAASLIDRLERATLSKAFSGELVVAD